MICGRALAAILLLTVAAGCSDGQTAAGTVVASEGVLLEVPPVDIPSPDGRMTLAFGGVDRPVLALRAQGGERVLTSIETTSRASWAPDSRHFFVNDSGSASWSTFRLWAVSASSRAVETPTIRNAAIAELGRLNGCVAVPEPDATTHGMGWSGDGRRVYVLAQTRRQSGGCVWKGVDYILVVADVATGRLLDVAQEVEARRRYSALPWAPVTTP